MVRAAGIPMAGLKKGKKIASGSLLALSSGRDYVMFVNDSFVRTADFKVITTHGQDIFRCRGTLSSQEISIHGAITYF